MRGKKYRHQVGLQKFKEYQQNESNKQNVEQLLNKDREKLQYIPKTGEYIVFSKDEKIDREEGLDIGIKDLLDHTKTFSQLKSIKNKQDSTLVLDESLRNFPKIDQKGRPQTAQTMVVDSQGFTITRNIKNVVRKQDKRLLSASNKVFNQIVNEDQEEVYQNRLTRDVVADIVKNDQTNTLLSNALSYDKRQQKVKKTSYQVISKTKQHPKYITGYNTIDLESQSRTDINKQKLNKDTKESPFLITNNNIKINEENEKKEQQVGGQQHQNEKFSGFLPLEYYLMENQKQLKEYQDEQGRVFGYSKWFGSKGEYDWKECEVLEYKNQKERYVIKWSSNGRIKEVGRGNLYFQKESKEDYQKMIMHAQHYRKQSEMFLKYNQQIDNYESNQTLKDIPQHQKDKIFQLTMGFTYLIKEVRDPVKYYKMDKKIKYNCQRIIVYKQNRQLKGCKDIIQGFKKKKYDLDYLNRLNDEANQQFRRVNKQCEFNYKLAFDPVLQKTYKGYLDDSLFVPVASKAVAETNLKGVIQVDFGNVSGVQHFQKLFKKMKQKLHQAEDKKIRTLLEMNGQLIEFDSQYFYMEKFEKVYSLEGFVKLQKEKQQEALRDFKSKMYDSHFVVIEMTGQEIDNMKKRNELRMQNIILEAERKANEEKYLPEQVVDSLKRFQKLINCFLERALRNCYEKSVDRLTNSFKKVLVRFGKEMDVDIDKICFEDVYRFQQIIQFERFDRWRPQIELKLLMEGESGLSYQPQLETVKQQIMGLEEILIEQIVNIGCLDTKEIGSARQNGKLLVFLENEDVVEQKSKQLEQVVNQILVFPKLLVDQLLELKSLIGNVNIDTLKKRFKKQKNHETYEEIQVLKKCKVEIERILNQEKINIGPFIIDCSQIMQQLEQRRKEQEMMISDILMEKIQYESERLKKNIDEIMGKLKEAPNNIEEMDQLQFFIKNSLEEQIYNLKMKIKNTMYKLYLLEEIQYKYDFGVFSKVWDCYGEPKQIMEQKEKCIKRLATQEKKFSQEVMNQQADLQQRIESIKYQLEILTNHQEFDEYLEISTKFENIGEMIEQAQKKGEIINRRQRILKWEETDYISINKIKQTWLPYNKVWVLTRDVQIKIKDALTGQLANIDRDQFTNDIIDSWNELHKLEKGVFKTIPHMLDITKRTKNMYNQYKPYLSIINDLLNPHLKNNRQIWLKIQEETKIDIDQELTVTFEQLLGQNILDFRDFIKEQSEIASKEQSFERILFKNKQEWKNIKFTLMEFRDSECKILKDIDPILDKLDEDITRIISISTSPYVKMIISDINNWRQQLQKTQDTIDLWLKVQKQWQYLQPIFLSPDIQESMPIETQKYQQVDKQWRNIMQYTETNPGVQDACFQNKLKEQFEYYYDLLDQVQKGLNDYLDTKRQKFPRFYFLSSDELLSILAQARDPLAVQPHLQKCFEGIDYLHFEDKQYIHKFYSGLGEEVEMKQVINVYDDKKVIKGVELWLQEIETGMQQSIQGLFNRAIDSYSKGRRLEWLFEFISQIGVTCERYIWTQMVEYHIQQRTLQKYYKELDEELLDIVKLVREKQDKIKRITLGTLIILEVHAREIVQEMHEKNINQIDQFEWQKQLRYYRKDDQIEIKMVNTNRLYGYEYLGNQERLVITQMTDRCYRTLMSALQMNLGGSPEGPAGTGKTETVKDLSKALAKYCKVFNCQDELDISIMSKFFKGLVSCGAWSCFDEFNRIETEVLSVIAQQVLQIQSALIKDSLKRQKQKQKKYVQRQFFTFEGTSIPLDPSCAIFTTMNPGYAGRSDLPDNLKALFRPVAMMVPDYKLISQISLYSYGFYNATQLSLKVTSSLMLASEVVSTQKHYDFGMRAHKSILQSAGNLKRELIDEDENILVLKAIIDINVPKFMSQDVPLFMDIISDLFPEQTQQNIFDPQLQQAIKQIAQDNHIQLNQYLESKIMQFYEMFKVRHGLMVIGQTLSSKSTIIDIIQKAITTNNYNQAQYKQLEQKQSLQQQIQNVQQTIQEELNKINQQNQEQGQMVVEQADVQPKLQNQQSDTCLVQRPAQVQELDKELQELQQKKQELDQEVLQYQKVKSQKLNPKSINIKNLYGYTDEASNEFNEGIAARIFRNFSEDRSNTYNWIWFDGPVDALWIENLNTVLDDNRKLCLPNGETIKLTNYMSVLFEAEDLKEASPATVSRNGMIYMESDGIQLLNLLNKWVMGLPKRYHSSSKQLVELTEKLVKPVIEWLFGKEKNVFCLENVNQQWLIMSCFNVLETMVLKGRTRQQIQEMEELEEEKERQRLSQMRFEQQKETNDKVSKTEEKKRLQEEKKLMQENRKNIQNFIGCIIYSIIWSFGMMVEENYRKQFEEWLRITMQEQVETLKLEEKDGEKLKFNEEYSVYDLEWDYERLQWNVWTRSNKPIEQEMEWHQIYIKTKDTLRNDYIINKLCSSNKNILLYGKTGTSKTTQLKQYLQENSKKMIATQTSFTATTTCEQSLLVFESKIEKQKRKKGVYGPLIGYMNVIFVDDINMPNKREQDYGAQPAIELIRQWMDQQGWYDLKTLEFKKIIDIQFMAAMGLGRPQFTNRLLRHFNILYLDQQSRENMEYIVKQYLEWGFHNYIDGVNLQIPLFSQCIINIFEAVQKQFLPLPSKTHYIFNLRDLLKIVQSVLKVPANQYNAIDDNRQQLIDLLFYESERVYADRLVDMGDKEQYMRIVKEQIENTYQNEQELNQNQYYSDILNDCYMKLDNNVIDQKIENIIDEYNGGNCKKPIDIVLFRDAKELLFKINRIISQVNGNGLLVGIGGIGRKTMTQLASFIQNYMLYDLEDKEINSLQEWQDFCKEMIKQVGVNQQKMVLLVNNNDIKYEKMLEDINSLLNTGEIPSLYPEEEKEMVLQELKELLVKNHGNKHYDQQYLQDKLVENTKNNMHIVLCLSPIGNSLRNKLKNYPSLISCTNIVWTQPWSEEALYQVAKHFLTKSGIENQLEEISRVCVGFHVGVRQKTVEYRQEYGKYYYVTPISYKKLLNNFKQFYEKQMDSLISRKQTYEQGVMKLEECNKLVANMKVKLEEMQPDLVQKTKQTEEIMKVIEQEAEEAEKAKEIVQKDEEITAEQARIAEGLQQQCQQRLSVAEPELQAAQKALKTLEIKHLVEIKTVQTATKPIKLTMTGIFIMLDQNIAKGKSAGKEEEYFVKSKKLLSNPQHFLDNLLNFKKEQLSEKTIKKIETFIEKNPDFTVENATRASEAAQGMCKWIFAMIKYYHVYQEVLPLRGDLEKANKQLQDATEELLKKRQSLQDIEEKIKGLNDNLQKETFEKQMLMAKITDCETKMKRAIELTGGLVNEREMWIESGKQLGEQMERTLGDILISVGFVSYLGAFTDEYRNRIVNKEWMEGIRNQQIKCSDEFSLESTIGDSLEIQNWILNGLPNNEVSIQNAIIMKNSKEYPLIIDPQNQGFKYINKSKSGCSDNEYKVCKAGKEMFRYLDVCIRTGATLVIQNVGESIDSTLDNILQQKVERRGSISFVQMGSNLIQYDDGFRLFLITKNPNPHYQPETLTKITLINFSITLDGLKDQMLNKIAQIEEPKDEEEKMRILLENSENNFKKKEIEQKILMMMQQSEGESMLDDDNLIQQLTHSKQTSLEIQQKMVISKATEEKINYNRQNYEIVARIASYMYFMIMQLTQIDPMYDFSLEFYIRLFIKAIQKAEKPAQKNVRERVENIKEGLLRQIFYEINRSLFVKDKLLFAFLMGVTNLQIYGLLETEEYKLMLTGVGGHILEDESRSVPEFMSNKQWDDLRHLSSLAFFKDIDQSFINSSDNWHNYIDNMNEAASIDLAKIEIQSKKTIQQQQSSQNLLSISDIEPSVYKNNSPDKKYNQLSNFQHLLLVKTLRPDLFIEKLKIFIKNELGEHFIQFPIISLEESFKESSNHIPLMFVLSPGDDPQQAIMKFAQDKGKILVPISLGKGQGEKAIKNINESIGVGNWVLLQNCHLAKTWLNELDELVEQMKENPVHSEFRLWLTTSSTDDFPRYLLQESVKMTKDPPKGIKGNVLELYSNVINSKQERAIFESQENQEQEWQKLFMGICFFHAIIRERRRFGPIGWNEHYEFNESDFKISQKQLQHMLNHYQNIPFDALNYLTGECYYGGRVTDNWDRILLRVMLEHFYCSDCIYINPYPVSQTNNEFVLVENLDLENAIEHIESLSDTNTPDLFGLHSNAQFKATQFETSQLIDSLLKVTSSSGSQQNQQSKIKQITDELLNMLPTEIDYHSVRQKYPNSYYESMNTVLLQEILRYNNLISTIKISLIDLDLALQGKIVLSHDLENMIEILQNQQLPSIWKKNSYLSNKPLISYIKDLQQRINYLNDWVSNNKPPVYWLSGFYFTPAFLTGILQAHARKFKIPIDLLKFNFEVLLKPKEEIQEQPETGCYVHGLFIDGAKWDLQNNVLTEQEHKQIYEHMPIIWMIPVDNENQIIKSDEKSHQYVYDCPVYKTSSRRGTLLTTGHSTNFIMTIKLKAHHRWQHWTKRGVALLSQLDD